jgi:hypothetical protein
MIVTIGLYHNTDYVCDVNLKQKKMKSKKNQSQINDEIDGLKAILIFFLMVIIAGLGDSLWNYLDLIF